jgi:hypothetical protein
VIGCFATLFWLAAQPSNASPIPTPKVSIYAAACDDSLYSAVRPPAIYLGCEDGEITLSGDRSKGLQWQTWGPKTADASGAMWEDSCTPDCASSQVWFMQPAQVQLSGLTITPCGLLFSTLSDRLATGLVISRDGVKVPAWGPWESVPLSTNCK